MVSGHLFLCRKHSWPAEEYVSRTTLQLLDFDGGAPPEQAWRRRLNSHANILKEFSVTFMEAIRMMRLGVRLWSYVREEASQGRKAPIDPFTRERCKPSASQGVPLGGMGSGSISRGFRGEFKHWQIIPGSCEASPVMTNQFSIFISRDGGNKKYSSVLAPGHHEGIKKFGDQGISSWDWNLSGQHSTYHALFPRAWTVYDGEPDPDLKISCRQISPFIPHNYHESSLPTSVFVYTLVNTGRERAKVSLLMTWANSIGGVSHHSGGHINEPFIGEDGVSGVLLHHKTAKDNPPVTFAIAACETQNVNVTVLPNFGLSGENCVTARDMWGTMVQDGQFDREYFNAGPSAPSAPGSTLCAAVSASTWVEPHGRCTVAFALAWSSPKVKFQKGCSYHRRYTKFYGTSERSAINLVHDALMGYKCWEEEIEKWQDPILKDEKLPEWYKFTLFNELYFLVAGGTVWTDGEAPVSNEKQNPGSNRQKSSKIAKEDANAVSTKRSHVNFAMEQISFDTGLHNGDEKMVPLSSAGDDSEDSDNLDSPESLQAGPLLHLHDGPENVGRFLYLEGVEYIMWCTYDVHFYASFALLDLFPKIELSIQRDFAQAVLYEDRRKVKFLADGNWGIRNVKGAVPHDLGTHDPWHEMNAYNIHDTSKWKDLNPKFVLQVYRDFAATGDTSFGRDVWPAVRAAIDYMEQFDRDDDGLIENDGFPDQTYDAWTVHGISAYCGCLWLAALQAAAAMAHRLGDHSFSEKCKIKFLKAKPVFEAKLWNGSYFNYDSGTSSNSRSIQADQLAGEWYTASSGLPSLFDDNKIRSTLQKIFEFNVMKVRGGRMGAVNGMHPNGKVDESCMQSREIWTGVTYSVAATMLLHGMEHQAFTTAEGIFIAGWSEEGYGYWFQTPEAWTTDGHYRSLMYMRPLAIWAMQWALSPPKAIIEAPKINMMDRMYISPLNVRAVHEMGVRKIAPKSSCFGDTVFHCEC
uniref:Non-lysosomal glucosylceramidase n=1 Tax=Elaeis guineensis var. tenera TaxID=51953 RepID=A0A6I9RAT0_ELAGV|nr:LOW QUALITY PROTEIN: non-lysosomal glucosylceramidase-like [Elaeis guineensis]